MKKQFNDDKKSGQYIKATRSQFGLGVGSLRFRTTVYQHVEGQFHIIRNRKAIPVYYDPMTGWNVAKNWQTPQLAFALGV